MGRWYGYISSRIKILGIGRRTPSFLEMTSQGPLRNDIYLVVASLSRITRERALTGGRRGEPRFDLISRSNSWRLRRKVLRCIPISRAALT